MQGWTIADGEMPETSRQALDWFKAELRRSADEISDLFSKYRLSEALMEVYRLFWDEFSSWLLEMVKPAYGQPIDRQTYNEVLACFNDLLHLLHPFMPFITEELWQHLGERENGESLMVSPQNIAMPIEGDTGLIVQMTRVKSIVSNVRAIRNSKNISPRETLELQVISDNPDKEYTSLIIKMANVKSVELIAEKAHGSATFMVETTEYAIPLGNLIDIEAEKAKALAELEHLRKFLSGIEKKLSNERFINNAPAAVVEMEHKKQNDAMTKIAVLEETLKMY